MAIPIDIAVEDGLSEIVVRRILNEAGRNYVIKTRYPTSPRRYERADPTGFGFLKKNAKAFNEASAVIPFFMLVDLDTNPCAATLLRQWVPGLIHPNFLFRVAVREVEAWLLADRKSMATFLGLPITMMSAQVERLKDPKQSIVGLARKSPISDVAAGLAPAAGSKAQVGPYYQRMMASFARNLWDIQAATRNCQSLSKAVERIQKFQPS